MKKALHILSSAVIALAALTSCAKEQFNENTIPAGEKIQVSINGQIGELTPADATKATAGSVVRVTWETGDEVYVYDGTARIGTLTVTPDEKNASYALLSGEIKGSEASPSKLTLVYVKGATEAPTIAGGKISIDISTQDQAEVPFVLYTTIDYDKDALTKTNEYISFSFATSVMTVNCTGLQTGTGNAVTKAEIDGVSTICELTVTGGGVTVAGTTPGTITRTGTSVFTQSDSRGSFRLAIAADPAAPAARNILVHQSSKVSGAPFTSATLAGGQSYNTVYQLSEYKSDGAGGYAPAVTGVTLAKDETTILVGTKETLEATVAPDNATNKQVKWSSSDTNIATVDENGEVTGVAAGFAVITATTTDGNFKAFCLVTVKQLPKGALFGEFSVGDNKKVYFSKGNLWYGKVEGATDATWNFEANQYDFQSKSSLDNSHISRFWWSKDASVAYAASYSDNAANVNDVLFTNTTVTTANPQFTVNGENGKYRTLSYEEWQYLLNDGNDIRKNKYKVKVTVCGKEGCIVLLPDNWEWGGDYGDTWAKNYTEDIWKKMEAAGAVCLPPAGMRLSDGINYVTSYYWSSTSSATLLYGSYYQACAFRTFVDPNSSSTAPYPSFTEVQRHNASSIRLVTDVPAE